MIRLFYFAKHYAEAAADYAMQAQCHAQVSDGGGGGGGGRG